MAHKAKRLELGVEIGKRVKAKSASPQEDIKLVLDEREDVLDGFADTIVETANAIRGNREVFRLLHDDIVIQIPALPRPTLEELKKDSDWIARIESDTSPTEAVTLRLATVLKSSESSVGGKTYEELIAPRRAKHLVLGYQQAKWLKKNQKKHPAFMDLLGRLYVDFSGLIVVSRGGDRIVPCLRSWEGDDQWDLRWGWIDDNFYDNGLVAVSSK